MAKSDYENLSSALVRLRNETDSPSARFDVHMQYQFLFF